MAKENLENSKKEKIIKVKDENTTKSREAKSGQYCCKKFRPRPPRMK